MLRYAFRFADQVLCHSLKKTEPVFCHHKNKNLPERRKQKISKDALSHTPELCRVSIIALFVT
jgi:hypothetical protein